jgi:sulfotransferase family protein
MKRRINDALRRATGLEVRRAPAVLTPEELAARQRRARRRVRPGDRLLERPTFVLCSVRSGSTLLRVLLDSHSRICAPHELHLRDIQVTLRTDYAERSLGEIGLEPSRLEYLLWDRMLQRELSDSGKELLVNKTPSDVFIVDRIRECWADARFIFLLRHPVSIARSRHIARPQDSAARNLKMVRRYCQAIESARQTYDGLTVRYEDITTDPERETRRVCEFLGVEWEPQMLDYGQFDHGRMKSGLGDWSEQIKSGAVQAAKPLPSDDEVPEELRELTAAWGYLSTETPSVAP